MRIEPWVAVKRMFLILHPSVPHDLELRKRHPVSRPVAQPSADERPRVAVHSRRFASATRELNYSIHFVSKFSPNFETYRSGDQRPKVY